MRAGLAFAFLRVGKIRGELGESQAATESFEKARALFEPLVKANPADPELSDGLAESLLGSASMEAIAIWRATWSGPARPDSEHELADAYNALGDTRLREELARSYQALGDSDLEAKEHRKALGAFLKAHDIEATLIRDQPDFPPTSTTSPGTWARSLSAFASSGGTRTRQSFARWPIEHARTAFEQSPQVVAYGRLYGRLLGKNGDNLFSQGRPDDGARAFRQAVSVQLRLIRENPAVPDPPGDLVETCASAIAIMTRGKRASEASLAARGDRRTGGTSAR